MNCEQTHAYFERLNSVNNATQAQINAMIVEEIKAKMVANNGKITYSELAIIAVKYTPSTLRNRMAMVDKFREVAAGKIINLINVCDEFRLHWLNQYEHTYLTIEPQELFYTLKANKNLTMTNTIESCDKDGKHYFQAACQLTLKAKKAGVLAKDAFTLMTMLEQTNHGIKYAISMKLTEQLFKKYCM
jgi:hypothetical protein